MKKINDNLNRYFPREYPVFFIHTHPDDESFLSAGLIKKIINNGNKCIVIYTSASIIKNVKITIIRQKEAISACKVLGTPIVEFLNYCDRKYTHLQVPTILNKELNFITDDILKVVNKYSGDKYILFIYDKNGGYGNIEHKKNHEIGLSLLEKDKKRIFNLSILTINRNTIKKWIKQNTKLLNKKDLPDLSYWSKDFGLESREIDYYIDLDEDELERKRRALMKHKTQMKKGEFPVSLKPKSFKEMFGREYIKNVF